MANHVLFAIVKYLIALTVITLLSIVETNAQLLHLNVLSFNNNRAGDNSLNNNGNSGVRIGADGGGQGLLNTVVQNPFSSWPSAVGAGIGLLAGSLLGRSYLYPSIPYYYYGGYTSYTPSYYYYSRYPYYYYRG